MDSKGTKECSLRDEFLQVWCVESSVHISDVFRFILKAAAGHMRHLIHPTGTCDWKREKLCENKIYTRSNEIWIYRDSLVIAYGTTNWTTFAYGHTLNQLKYYISGRRKATYVVWQFRQCRNCFTTNYNYIFM